MIAHGLNIYFGDSYVPFKGILSWTLTNNLCKDFEMENEYSSMEVVTVQMATYHHFGWISSQTTKR